MRPQSCLVTSLVQFIYPLSLDSAAAIATPAARRFEGFLPGRREVANERPLMMQVDWTSASSDLRDCVRGYARNKRGSPARGMCGLFLRVRISSWPSISATAIPFASLVS
jgi:hypothetical protein